MNLSTKKGVIISIWKYQRDFGKFVASYFGVIALECSSGAVGTYVWNLVSVFDD